jgi:hypothetical protein
VNWKWIFAAGALAGAVLAARKRSQKAVSDSELWAAATDPVAPFGDHPG